MSNDEEGWVPSFETCDEVTDRCPVDATLYGDYFTTGGTILFAGIFAGCVLIQLYAGLRLRSWSFLIYLFLGTGFECVGYLGRAFMSRNPWNYPAFAAQLLALILGPTLVAAAISVTFKHLVIYYYPEISPIRPTLLPWIFVGTDFLSIVIQGIGGAIAGSATNSSNPDQTLLDLAEGLLIGGVAFQVFNMVFCGGLMVWFWRRYVNHSRRSASPVDQRFMFENTKGRQQHKRGGRIRGFLSRVRHDKTRTFIFAISFAYLAVLVRCIYRIPEMSEGWGSSLMQSEATFMVFDGTMMVLACITLTIFHPWWWFKPLKDKYKTTPRGHMKGQQIDTSNNNIPMV